MTLKHTAALKQETRQEVVAKEVRHELHMAFCLGSFLEANSKLENSGRPRAPLQKKNKNLPSLGHPDWPIELPAHAAWDPSHTPDTDFTGSAGHLLPGLALRLHFPHKRGTLGGCPTKRKIEPNPRSLCSKHCGRVLEFSLLK